MIDIKVKCRNCGTFTRIEDDGLKRIYEQGRADAIDIDMEKPMHFTDEQKAWVKNYIILNAKRQRADAIDKISNEIDHLNLQGGGIDDLQFFLEQLKEQR